MKGFIRVHQVDVGPVLLGTFQIASVRPVPLHNKGIRASIKLSTGDQIQTTETWEEVNAALAEATEPATPPAKGRKPT